MIIFSSDHYEENNLFDQELVRLKPFGLSLSSDPNRPTLLFKDELQVKVLPVPLTPVEAAVALSQSNFGIAQNTPHKPAQMIVETMGLVIEKCVFVEIRNGIQYCRLYFQNHPTHGSIKIRSDEVVSFCLHLGIPFFAPNAILEKSKIMNEEVNTLAQGLQLNPQVFKREHQYIQ